MDKLKYEEYKITDYYVLNLIFHLHVPQKDDEDYNGRIDDNTNGTS